MRKTAASLAVMVALGASFVAASPAQAALPGVSGRLTMWANDNYKFCQQSRVSYDSNFRNDYCVLAGEPYGFDDELSSFVNKTSSWWILFEDRDQSGARICVRPNSHDNNIGNDTGYEDDISSVEKHGSSQPANCRDVTGDRN